MDELEKFIEENRSDFDQKAPRDKVWEKIHAQLQEKKVRKIPFYKYAAAAVLLLGLGFAIGLFTNSRQNDPMKLTMDKVKESEDYYTKLVSNKMDELSNYNYDEKLLSDIELLDKIHIELKEEIIKSSSANSEIVIQAMMTNYQTKFKCFRKNTN